MTRLAPTLFATAAAVIATLGSPASQAQASLVGAYVSGYAWADFVIGCNTCSHLPITLDGEPVQYVEGPALASVDYVGGPVRTAAFDDYTLAGGVSYRGQASFEGVLMTPLLGAQAHADNEQAFIVDDPDVPVGIDLYQASVDAGTRMLYQYAGAASTNYTFNFVVDGQIGNEQASVFASVGLYGGPTLDLETGLIDFGYASFTGTGIAGPLQPFAGNFSATIAVDPGDSFWLVANLGPLAAMTYSSADVSVDAYHTMRLASLTGGDPGLLLATPVPELPPALMLALGLAALGLRQAGRTGRG